MDFESLFQHELEGHCTDVAVEDFVGAMWISQNDRINRQSLEWMDFIQHVSADATVQASIQEYKGARTEVDLYTPFVSLITRMTALLHEDQAFGKRCVRKPMFCDLGDRYIRSAPSSESGGSEDNGPAECKLVGVGIIDYAGQDSTSIQVEWQNAILCMEFEVVPPDYPSDGPPWDKSCSSTDKRSHFGSSEPGSSSINTSSGASNLTPPPESKMDNSSHRFGKKSQTSPCSQPNHLPSPPVTDAPERSPSISASETVHGMKKFTNSAAALSGKGGEQAIWGVASVAKTYSYSESGSNSLGVAISKQGSTTKASKVNPGRVQLASYAAEVFHALGNRTHVYGILAISSNITFAYFDRGGAIFASFDLNEDDALQHLIDFVVAFSILNIQALGFNIHLQPDQGATPESKLAFTRNSLRGFTVMVDGRRVEMKKLLEHRYGIVTRATLVYLAKIDNVDDLVVIKLSWQPCQRTAEWEFVKYAQENGCPKEYLIEVYASARFEDLVLSRGFRSHFLNKGLKLHYEDRELRVQVSERLFPIGRLPSEHFMHAMYLILEAVDHLDQAGIRHRDISSGNTGWNIRKKNGVRIFVAFPYDLDLAKFTAPDQQRTSTCRTGTTPFMAIDLLHHPNYDHFLRFDYESCFWLALYHGIRQDDSGNVARYHNVPKGWTQRTPVAIARWKKSCIEMEEFPICSKKHLRYSTGILCLADLLSAVYGEQRKLRRLKQLKKDVAPGLQDLSLESVSVTQTPQIFDLSSVINSAKWREAIGPWWLADPLTEPLLSLWITLVSDEV
ncbi:hypothetical protein FRC03_009996 [Tulasnella sp. 419]|nr:hypothetical protein FRC03_009996 [Tulasnella sp. 419]